MPHSKGKRAWLAGLAGLVLTTFAGAQGNARRIAPDTGRPVRVLALGDSITQGGQGFASYRYPLWYELLARGRAVDFVGSRSTVFGGDGGSNPDTSLYPSYYTSFDRQHEGYWGYRTDQVLALALDAARFARPDVVLVHLGTNDVGQSGANGVASAAVNLPRILDAVRAERPSTRFLLAEVIPIGPGSSYFANASEIPALNAAIAAVALAETSLASPIALVDQFTGFDLGLDMQPDGLHPDASGEARMAGVWADALGPLLDAQPPPRHPAIVLLDPSFEALGTGDQIVTEAPDIDWGFGVTPATFRGIFNPGADSYLGAAGSGTPVGGNGDEALYLYNNGGAFERALAFQTLVSTFDPRRTYTLTIAVGNRLATNPYGPSTWGGYRIELLAGNAVIASQSDALVPTSGTFADAVLTVPAGSVTLELARQALTIRLALTTNTAGGATDFDDVRLAID